MTVNTDKKRRRICAKADEEEEKQKLHHLSISQPVITVSNDENMRKRRRISSKEEEKGTHLSNLFPHDIMLDILSRLPVKPLMRFRSVSKSWNYLIRKDQFFINMHLSHAKLQHEKMILIDFECHNCLYSLDYNSWKKNQNIPYIASDLHRPAEFLYGSLHWVAHSKFIKLEIPEDSNSEDSDSEYSTCEEDFISEENTILAFEITTENFVEVPCPDIDHGIMIVGQYQGKLCFYLEKMGVTRSFDLWVMNEYKVRESWSKVFNIQKPRGCCYSSIMRFVLATTKEGYILMRSSVFGNEHLILYDPKQKTRRQILGIEVWGEVNYYVPSIVAFDF